MTTSISSYNDLMIIELQDLFHTETRLISFCPALVDKASSLILRNVFTNLREQSLDQQKRIIDVFSGLNIEMREFHSELFDQILAGFQISLQTALPSELFDLKLITEVRQIQHFQIAGYRTVCSFARKLGFRELYKQMDLSLKEEITTEHVLTNISKKVNMKANV